MSTPKHCVNSETWPYGGIWPCHTANLQDDRFGLSTSIRSMSFRVRCTPDEQVCTLDMNWRACG